MAEKPIIFSSEGINAILEGRKSQTCRVIKPQPVLSNKGFWELGGAGWSEAITNLTPIPCHTLYNRMPYKPEDVLWVRETWAPMLDCTDGKVKKVFVYKASVEEYYQKSLMGTPIPGWHPPAHMPRVAARIFLRVLDGQIERVQAITEEDAKAEGVTLTDACEAGSEHFTPTFYNPDNSDPVADYVGAFQGLWDSINSKRGYGWNTNPFVWVYSFERLKDYENLQ